MFNKFLDDSFGIFQGQWGSWSDAIGFESAMPSLDFPVGLRVVGRSPHMGESGQANELFEIPRHELQPIVGNDPGMNSRVFLQRLLHHPLDVGFLHGGMDFPVKKKAAAAILFCFR